MAERHLLDINLDAPAEEVRDRAQELIEAERGLGNQGIHRSWQAADSNKVVLTSDAGGVKISRDAGVTAPAQVIVDGAAAGGVLNGAYPSPGFQPNPAFNGNLSTTGTLTVDGQTTLNDDLTMGSGDQIKFANENGVKLDFGNDNTYRIDLATNTLRLFTNVLIEFWQAGAGAASLVYNTSTGALSAVSATLSGALAAASATLTGNLTVGGTSALNGNVTLGSAIGNTAITSGPAQIGSTLTVLGDLNANANANLGDSVSGDTTTVTSILKIVGRVVVSVISPSSFGSSQNDWGPTGINDALIVQMDPTANVDITGIAASQVNGRILSLVNRNSTNTVTLKHDSASSSADNRFHLPSNADMALGPHKSTLLYWWDNGGTRRWRTMAWS